MSEKRDASEVKVHLKSLLKRKKEKQSEVKVLKELIEYWKERLKEAEQ